MRPAGTGVVDFDQEAFLREAERLDKRPGVGASPPPATPAGGDFQGAQLELDNDDEAHFEPALFAACIDELKERRRNTLDRLSSAEGDDGAGSAVYE